MPSLIDLSGKQINRWTVIRRDADSKTKKARWICECACGTIKSVMADSLQKRASQSCGCYHREAASLRFSKMAENNPPLNERFKQKILIDRETGCHVWVGAKQSGGYGAFVIKTHNGKIIKKVIAHRYAWEIANGPIHDWLCVLHKCDNPPCVNVDHLFLGTLGDNNKDRAAKGRSSRKAHGNLSCEQHPSAKLTNSQVLSIIESRRSIKELALRFEVGYHTIWKIKAGKSWTKIRGV